MNTTAAGDRVLREILQILLETGLQGFPEAMTMLYTLAMQFEREFAMTGKSALGGCRTKDYWAKNRSKMPVIFLFFGHLPRQTPSKESLPALLSSILALTITSRDSLLRIHYGH